MIAAPKTANIFTSIFITGIYRAKIDHYITWKVLMAKVRI
jgi:hypothetical protein